MWELDYKESWVPKNWCFWTVVLEKTPESPLNSMEIKPVNVRGNQPWLLVGRTEAAAIVFWSPGANRQLIGKVPDAGKDWGQKKRVSEDEMVGWHYWCNGLELGQTLGDGEGQGGLVCCSPWGHKKSDTSGWLNNSNSNNNPNILPFKHMMNIKILKFFYFFIPSFQNPVYILHLKHISNGISHLKYLVATWGYHIEWHRFRLNNRNLNSIKHIWHLISKSYLNKCSLQSPNSYLSSLWSNNKLNLFLLDFFLWLHTRTHTHTHTHRHTELLFIYLFWSLCTIHRILVLQPGIGPVPPCSEVQSPNY